MEEFKFTDLRAEAAGDSITIKWMVETKIPADRLYFEAVLVGESDDMYNVSDPLQMTDSYTFTDLNANTAYSLFIRAYDGDDFLIEYPGDGLTVTTPVSETPPVEPAVPEPVPEEPEIEPEEPEIEPEEPEIEPEEPEIEPEEPEIEPEEPEIEPEQPKIESKELKVSGITENGFSISWEKEKGNDIRYRVFLKEADDQEGSWVKILDRKNIGSTKVKDLKADTRYVFYVDAFLLTGIQIRHDEGSAKTAIPVDKEAPSAASTIIRVSDITYDGFMISWDPASDNVTDSAFINYKVFLKATLDKGDPWRVVHEQQGITSFQFKELKEGTQYFFYVEAFDEAGNKWEYLQPRNNASFSAKTLAHDTEAPVAGSKALTVTGVTCSSITIGWSPASDNETAAADIVYKVFLKESDNSMDPWHLAKEATGICSFTFTGLKDGTKYAFNVKAYDKAGNMLQYPGDNACMTAETKPNRVNRLSLSIRQKAIVLPGKQTILLDLAYNRVRFDANGQVVERQPGDWLHKWSNNDPVDEVITLPSGWYFENSQVHITIKSRKGVTAGLHVWKTCSEGDLDISGGSLSLNLTGHYFTYSVRYSRNK